MRETMGRPPGRPFACGEVAGVAVQVNIKFDSAAFRRELRRNAEMWPKAVDLTIKTMARRAPVIVARTAAQTYNIAQAKLNPRNKNSKGSVSLSGGLTDLTLTYKGEKLPIKDFKGLKPTGPRKRPYTITVQVLMGSSAKVGHWSMPGSEGGRYSGNSPWMLVPGVPGPVMRLGGTLGNTMRALSVPQMVGSVRHEAPMMEQLQQTMFTELERLLALFGIS